MKMKAKVFFFCLALCCLLAFVPFQTWAADSGSQPAEGSAAVAASSFPARFDLRDLGVVTPVKQQNPWGSCWSFSATAAAETSILTKMGSTYAATGLDLSERHLAWYVARPVTEKISPSQAGEGLNVYNQEAGPNHIFNFGGREECAATLYAQGIGPVAEADYPYEGANHQLAYEDLLANKEEYIALDMAALREFDQFSSDEYLRECAELDYEFDLDRYAVYDVYSPLDDWSVTDADEPGSGKLRGSSYTLTDNNVITYWIRKGTGDTDSNERYEREGNEPIVTWESSNLYQDSIDQIKAELYAGRGVSVDFSIDNNVINGETWAVYNDHSLRVSRHAVCIVGWDDNYPASNFTHTRTPSGEVMTDSSGREIPDEKAIAITTPAGDGAWICKNSWGSETDMVEGGLVGPNGETKDANGSKWGIVDENGLHTGYFYLSYYDYTIGVPESFDFELRENHDQENALQLDYLPASAAEWRNNNTSPMWEANVFTLDQALRIDEVATRIRMTDLAPLSGFTCTFELYKLNDGAVRPDDGELLATCTRTFQNEGYHRAALDAPVYLKAGDRLGVVVQQSHTFEDGVTKYCVSAQETIGYRENPRWRRDPLWGNPVVNEGESFWKADGITDQEEGSVGGWLDMTAPLTSALNRYLNPETWFLYENGYLGSPLYEFFRMDNFCIKAFGEPVTLEHVEAAEATAQEPACVEHWLDPQSGQAYADEAGTIPLYLVTVSGGQADKKLALAGETVSLTAVPRSNAKFLSWKVTDGAAKLEDSGKQETSFQMPAGNVTVAGVYKNSSGEGGSAASVRYSVALPDASANGSVTASARTAQKGEQITLTLTPAAGYQAAPPAVQDAKGNAVAVTDNGDGTYTFTMPASDVAVTAVFTKLDEGGYRACPKDDTCPLTPFADTDKQAWYHDGVHWALDEGIMQGTGAASFEPGGSATRAMVVTMLWRLEGRPTGRASSFTDVPAGSWYEQAVNWAAESGVVSGTSAAAFSPHEPITREQLAAILYRYAQSKGRGFAGEWVFPLDFPDAAAVSGYADEAMCWMTMQGIITGMGDGTLAPQEKATRAQIAAMFMRFCETMAE